MRPRNLTSEQSAAAAQIMLSELIGGQARETSYLAALAGVDIRDAREILLGFVAIGALVRLPQAQPALFCLPKYADQPPPKRKKDRPPFWARSVWDYGARP